MSLIINWCGYQGLRLDLRALVGNGVIPEGVRWQTTRFGNQG